MTSPEKISALFICSRNQWRSPTAEKIWKNDPRVDVRSAGTSPNARRTVSEADIAWSDIVFVMEKKHKNRLEAKFSRRLQFKKIMILDIPDEYQFMDAELIQELTCKVNPYLADFEGE